MRGVSRAVIADLQRCQADVANALNGLRAELELGGGAENFPWRNSLSDLDSHL